MISCGVVWCDVVVCCLVWCVVVWHGVVRCDVVWCGVAPYVVGHIENGHQSVRRWQVEKVQLCGAECATVPEDLAAQAVGSWLARLLGSITRQKHSRQFPSHAF